MQSSASFLRIALRHWKFILGAVIVAALGAGLGTVLLARIIPTYQTEAHIVVTGARYQLNFDPKFRTVDTIGDAQTAQLRDRGEEFRVVALSTEVQRLAAETLAGGALSETQSPSDLLGQIQINVKGATIVITAAGGNPALAARRANAYAEAVTKHFNDVFGETQQNRVVLKQQLSNAATEYNAAEAELTEYLRRNPQVKLNQDIDLRRTFMTRLLDLSKTQGAVNIERLVSYYSGVASLDLLRRDTEALRRQIQTAGNSPAGVAAGALSLMSLQNRFVSLSLGGGSGGPSQVTLDVGSPGTPGSATGTGSGTSTGSSGATAAAGQRATFSTGAASPGNASLPVQLTVNGESLLLNNDKRSMVNDLDALLAGMDLRRENLLKAFDELSQYMTQTGGIPDIQEAGQSRIDTTVEKLNAEIQDLQAQLRQESLQQSGLENKVTSTRSVYTTLATKVQEADLSEATKGSAATVVSTAVAPRSPSFPPPLLLSLPIGALVGLILGAIGAVLGDAFSPGSAGRRVVLSKKPL